MTTATAVALGVAGIALLLSVVLAFQLSGVRKKLDVVPADGNVFEALRRLDEDLGNAEKAIGALQPRVQSLLERMPGAIRHVGVVTYDAYGDMVGSRSRSIAILNERGDGLVLSMLVGRTDSVIFTKEVRDGKGTEMLSPEEQAAIARAAQQ